MPDIKILIAAHKASELPKNPLFLPVEVGAANRKQHLPGYQRDDQGDNISKQNPNYCELTAIYWGWKNLKCDYCGIMHYRRFFSFTDNRYPVSADGRKMIRWPAATEAKYKEFGLTDETSMRKLIESNDLIVAESQNVKEIYTPRNKRRNTVEKHYIDHEDCIIKMKDLYLAIEIAKEKYPEVAPYLNRYMHQKMYLGYNMWIAKKPIYDEICDFMFSVLAEVEKRVDIHYYSVQMARIYGYLAEVLSSAYIYYIRQTRNLKVSERQMIYIENTEKITPIAPTDKTACPVVFDLTLPTKTQYLPMLFAPCFDAFLKSLNPKKKYDAIIFYNDDATPITASAIEVIKGAATKYPNCNLRCFNLPLELARCNVKYEPKKSLLNYFDVLPFQYQKIIYLKWSTIVYGDISELYGIKLNHAIGATADLITAGKANEFRSTTLAHLEKIGLTRDDILDAGVMLIDVNKFKKLPDGQNITESIMTAYSGNWDKLPQEWNYQAPLSPSDEYTMSLAPAEDFSKRGDYKIISFDFDNVKTIKSDAFYIKYFALMKESAVFPCYLETLISQKEPNYANSMVMTETFPVGSPKRELLHKLFPHNTRRRKLINMALKVFLRD